VPNVAVGLLGADLTIANGRYRIAKILRGESWNPGLRAPLGEPGVNVNEGDYLLEVNGTPIRAPEEPYKYFEGLANKQVSIRVGPNPSNEGSRVVTVVPIATEGQLRQREWIENNRKTVDRLSGGKLAYVWLPNTGQPGYTNFNRYYFAQQDKQGAVIDERYNGGGSAADYIIEFMMRQPHGYFNNPVADRKPFTSPAAGIWGPKVMIINEMAGSGGDLMPFMFRYYNVGPLVGKRTWGGLVGTWDTPPLVDGGSMIAPRRVLRHQRQVGRRKRWRAARHRCRIHAQGSRRRSRPATRARRAGSSQAARDESVHSQSRAAATELQQAARRQLISLFLGWRLGN
jgi:tricorn protease